MAKFLISEVEMLDYTGMHDHFLVDVTVDGGISKVCRGYVCGVAPEGLFVKFRPRDETATSFPFSKVRLVERQPKSCIIQGNVEVLLNASESDPEYWCRARVLDTVTVEFGSTCGYSRDFSFCRLTRVDVGFQSKEANVFVVIEGPFAATQRVRPTGSLGAPVTETTFQQIRIAIPESSDQYPEPFETLKYAMMYQCFHSFWWDATKTHLLSFDVENYVELLARKSEKLDLHQIQRVILSLSRKCASQFLNQIYRIVGVVLQDIIMAVGEKEERGSGNVDWNMEIRELPHTMRFEVVSFLDIYSRNHLKRVSSCWLRLLSSRALGRCLIVPYCPGYHSSDDESRNIHWIWCRKNSLTLMHNLSQTVSTDTSIVYLRGNWINCLSPVTDFLKFCLVKLEWLIVEQNSALSLHEILHLPQLGHLSGPLLQRSEYAEVTKNLLFKKCSFRCDLSYVHFDMRPCNHHEKLEFTTRIPHCIFRHDRIVNPDEFTAAALLMLEKFCDEPPDEKLHHLHRWFACLSDPQCYISPLVRLSVDFCFKRWNVKPPKTIVGCFAFANANPRRKLILHSLAQLTAAGHRFDGKSGWTDPSSN